MKRFTIVERTPVMRIRYFEVKAESANEAFQKVKEGIGQEDPVEPFRVDYEETLDSPMYYTDWEEEVNI